MSGKRALLLLSGGIDSPAAGHLLKEAGFTLEAVHFSLEPFTDAAAEEKAARLAGLLDIPRLHVVPAGEPFAAFTKHCHHAYYFVLSKRFMARVADALADRLGCAFLATGENLAQVSSQTLTNLSTIDAAARHPVLRPLLAYDKQEIIDLARGAGTYDVSVGPEVCDVLGPDHPVTTSTAAGAENEEAKLDVDALVAAALEGTRLNVTAGPATAAP